MPMVTVRPPSDTGCLSATPSCSVNDQYLHTSALECHQVTCEAQEHAPSMHASCCAALARNMHAHGNWDAHAIHEKAPWVLRQRLIVAVPLDEHQDQARNKDVKEEDDPDHR